MMFLLLPAPEIQAQIPLDGLGPGLDSAPARSWLDYRLEIRDLDPARRQFDLALVLDFKPGFHAVIQKDFLWLKMLPAPGVTASATRYSPSDMKILDEPAYGESGTLSLTLTLDEATWNAMEARGITLETSWSWQICDDAGQCFVPKVTKANLGLRGNPPALEIKETAPAGRQTRTSLGLGYEEARAQELAASGSPGEPPADGGGGSTEVRSDTGSGLAGTSPLLMLLFAFLGGIILNIMPCVLPVLSLKVLALVESREEGSASRQGPRQGKSSVSRLGLARLKALAGTAGMVGTVLALGVLVLAFKAGGQAVGWGFQFQNPHFVLLLLLLVMILGLSMLGVWQFRLPARRPQAVGTGSAWGTWKSPEPGSAGSGDDPAVDSFRKPRGLGRSFADGVLMVVLATPCSAPFLGSAMGFALAAPPLLSLATFLFLGLGLALPFFLLAWFPALRAFIPRPGPWMDSLKTVLAFLLFGTAAWLGGISISQIGPAHAGSLLGLVTVLAFAFWIWGRSQLESGKKLWSLRLAGLAALVAGMILLYPWDAGNPGSKGPQADPGAQQASVVGRPDGPGVGSDAFAMTPIAVSRGGVDWRVFSPEAVAAAQAAGSPVFIDFGAAWCLTCGVNEKGILSDPEALKGLASLGTRFFQGDFTLADPAILSWMQEWDRAAVPFYQVLKPDGSGQVLPELLGRSDLEKAAAWLAGTLP